MKTPLSPKDKKELLITVFLIIVFIFIFAGFLSKLARSRRAPSYIAGPVVKKQKISPSTEGIFKRKVIISEEFSRKVEAVSSALSVGRDPFSPATVKTKDASGGSGLVLQGISWSEAQPVAVINELSLKEGDSIKDYQVKKINKENVILNNGSRDLELGLPQ